MKGFIVLALAFASANAAGLALGGYAGPAICGGAYTDKVGTSDPTIFIQCSNGIPNVQKCAYGTVWNAVTNNCEHTLEVPAALQVAAAYGAPGPIAHAGIAHGAGIVHGAGIAHGAAIGHGIAAVGHGVAGIAHAGAIAGPIAHAGAIAHAGPVGYAGAGYGGNVCGGAYDALIGADGEPGYIQCSNGIPVPQKCAYGTAWSNYTKRCE